MRMKSNSCLINVGIVANKIAIPCSTGKSYDHFCDHFVHVCSLSRGTRQLCIPVKYKKLAVHTNK